MVRFKSSIAVLALGLGACMGTNDGLTPERNTSLYSVNQPVVQRTDYVLDLGTSGSGLASSEQARLDDWFRSLQLGYGDRIYVDDGGYAQPASRDQVASVAAHHGLLLSEGAPVTAGNVQPGSVRVVVSRTTAHVPDCPNWEEIPYGARVSTHQNYGCATNSNLAAMIADPNDLVLGQTGSGDRGGATARKAIETYRTKAPTGAGNLKSEKTGG
jgi:pilus assembly protein CpaD